MEAAVTYPDIFLEGHRETIYLRIARDLAEIRIKYLLITDLQQ
jgi:hypothetical protein